MSKGVSVNINQAKNSLRRIIQYNLSRPKGYRLVPFLWSAPGVGKSSIIFQLAEEFGMGVKDVRLATMSVLDLRGVPYKDDKGEETLTRWARPEFAQSDGNYILFLDELPSAPPTVQAAAYEIMLDRKVGGHPLPDDVIVVAAGNRQEDRGVVYEMPVPLRNRLVHYNIEPDVDAFIEYGMQKGINEAILAFLKFNPKLLHQMPSGTENAFPTPRSWEFLSGVMHMGIEFHDMAGIIGEGAAAEFNAFLKIRNKLPDVPKLLEKGEVWRTDELSLQYAFTFSLATHFIQKYEEVRKSKAQKERLINNFIDIVSAQDEEMMVLSFFLVRGVNGLVGDLLLNEKYTTGVINKVSSVLRPQ